MDTLGALLAAGGKSGHAAVFGIQQALVSYLQPTQLLLPYCLTTRLFSYQYIAASAHDHRTS